LLPGDFSPIVSLNMETAEKTRERVIGLIEAFLRKHAMSERQFSISAVADPKFISRLKGGFGVTLTSIEKAEAFMAEYVNPAMATLAASRVVGPASVIEAPERDFLSEVQSRGDERDQLGGHVVRPVAQIQAASEAHRAADGCAIAQVPAGSKS